MNTSQESNCEDFPSEVKQSIRELHQSLEDLKQCLKEYNDNYIQMKSQSLNPLLKAKIEWTNAYAINSLFWIYLTTKGVDPHNHPIKQEITRLRSYGQRLQQIEDKEMAVKVDIKAANRFIRSALWEPEDNEKNGSNSGTSHKRKPSKHSSGESKSHINDNKRQKT